ncbi:hypothetical protein ACWEV3_16580 [Saccharopolyspora sp. NPDC003752]
MDEISIAKQLEYKERPRAGETERNIEDIRASLTEGGWSAADYEFYGDLVQGHKFVQIRNIDYNVDTEPVLHTLTDDELAEYDDHVPAPEQASLRKRVSGSVLTVLSGPAGWGRAATATDLLRCAGAEHVVIIDPLSDLSKLGKRLFRPGAGLLVPDCPAKVLRRLSEAQLRHLLQTLREGQGRMVITSDVIADDLRTSLHNHVVKLGKATPRRDILVCHLRRITTDARAAELIDSAAAQAWLAENAEASATMTVRFVEELAVSPDLSQLSRQERQRRRAAVADKIAYSSCWQWPWLLTAAVHNNQRWRDAIDSASRLFDFFEMDDRRKQQLALANTKGYINRSSTIERIQLGAVPIETIQLQQPESRAWIVERVWTVAGTYREPLLKWLCWLGEDHHETVVRHSAAATVGQLMNLDFVDVAYNTVEKWVGRLSLESTESAAIALSFAADNRNLRSAVVRLAQSWARADETRKLGAAAAFGVPLGTRAPEQAIAVLDDLMHNSSTRLRYRIGRSLADLAYHQPDVLLPSVLSLVNSWATSHNKNLTRGSVTAFLMLANDLAVSDTKVSHPRLLALWMERNALRNHLDDMALLWRMALTDQDLYKIARNYFSEWAEMCDLSPQYRDAFAELTREITNGDRRILDIVTRIAQGWDSGERKVYAPATSAAVLSRLSSTSRAQ